MHRAPRSTKPFAIRKLPGFTTIAIICFFLLYAPLLPLVVYSFNAGVSLAFWEGFSFRWYVAAWQNEQVQDATIRSLYLAAAASVSATVLATMAALGTTRTRPYRGLTAIYAMINQPLMVPEIVTAVALLILFASIKAATGYHGMAYLIVAHTAFCIPLPTCRSGPGLRAWTSPWKTPPLISTPRRGRPFVG